MEACILMKEAGPIQWTTASFMETPAVSVTIQNSMNVNNIKLKLKQDIPQDTAFRIIKKHPNLNEVKMTGPTITDNILTALAKCCPYLTSVNFYRCWRITDAGLKDIVTSCPNLISINIGYCPNVTDSGVINLARLCPNLIAMNLSYNYHYITLSSLDTLVKSCPNLTKIDLTGCTEITNSVGWCQLSKTFDMIEFVTSKYIL